MEGDEEAVEIHLFVILHGQVLVALAALEVHTHEEPARVAGGPGVVGVLLPHFFQAPRDKETRAAQFLILEVRSENLPRHLVPWLVRAEGLREVAPPLVVVAVAFHQLDMKRLGDLLREARRGHALLDDFGALVRRLISDELPGFTGIRNAAGEVQPGAAEKFGVVRGRGERLLGDRGFAGDELVHPAMQGLRRHGSCASHGSGQQQAAREQGGWSGRLHRFS